jgi:hypothetical protein
MHAVKRIERIAVQVVHIEKKREIGKEDAEYLITDATEQSVRFQRHIRVKFMISEYITDVTHSAQL